MTETNSSSMPRQIIDCISAGRDPTVQELMDVARRIWIDGAAGRSAFSWGHLVPGSDDRLIAIRGAQLALIGTAEVATRKSVQDGDVRGEAARSRRAAGSD